MHNIRTGSYGKTGHPAYIEIRKKSFAASRLADKLSFIPQATGADRAIHDGGIVRHQPHDIKETSHE
ncbi:MAG: hypothetical protein LBQ62_10520 [Candidatus Accumulibacter sp.]|jgi:hypothetical protein|nr:hypothetical protein [Accumulibacter sp.]